LNNWNTNIITNTKFLHRFPHRLTKQVMIGQYAIVFEKALKAAGYALESTEKPVEKLPDDPGTQMPSKPKTSVWSFIFDLIASIFGAKK